MKLFLLITVGAASLWATPAAASAASAQGYLACVAQKHPAAVRELLRATTRAAADRPYRTLRDDERCLTIVFGDQQFDADDMTFPLDVLRGKLAEQSLVAATAQTAALAPLPFEQKRYLRPWFAATGRDPSIDEMGACVADTDPATVMTLLKTTPGAPDEDQAVAALAPSLARCLSAGTRLQAGRPSLRAALAEALYQRMISPALSVPAPETPK